MRGSIPANIHITDGKWHDSNELDEIEPEPYAIYAMDKAYVDFLALYRYHQAGAFWVSRAKDNMRYRIIETRTNFKASSGIRADYSIQLVTSKSKTLYPENIRYVRCYDEDNDEMVVHPPAGFSRIRWWCESWLCCSAHQAAMVHGRLNAIHIRVIYNVFIRSTSMDNEWE